LDPDSDGFGFVLIGPDLSSSMEILISQRRYLEDRG
jgi:hypothetical protein